MIEEGRKKKIDSSTFDNSKPIFYRKIQKITMIIDLLNMNRSFEKVRGMESF